MRLPTRWIKVLKDIWGNKTRTVLVIVSIAVGAFAVGMTTNARLIIRRDLDGAYLGTNPASMTLFITPFGEDLASDVEDMPEVSQAKARRSEVLQVCQGNDKWMDIELTVVPDYDRVRISQFTVESGQSTPGPKQILLERMTARMLNVAVGDVIRVKFPGQDGSYTLDVKGIVHDMNKLPPQFFDQGAGYVAMETLEGMGAGGLYNSLQIVVSENRTNKDHILYVTNLVRKHVVEPKGHKVVRQKPFLSDPGTHWASRDISGVLAILLVIGGMCLLLGAALVINTISALISQQVKQIGIIRSLGGLRRQIAAMYLTGVLIVGVCALLIAIPLGLLGAKGLVAGIGEEINFDVTRVALPISVALLQVGLGLLVPIGAAIVPILSGTRITVYDAIYQHDTNPTVNKGTTEELLKKLKGLSSTTILAVRNTFRRKTRLVFTLATLALTGATFMAAFSTHLTLREQISSIGHYWMMDAEMEVPGGADIATVERAALDVEGVEIAEGWYRATAHVVFSDQRESEGIEAMALPYDATTVDPVLIAGRWLKADDANAIVVNEDLLDVVPNLDVGSAVVLRVDSAKHETIYRYVVVGIVSRHLNGPRIYTPYEFFTKVNHARDQVNLVRVRTDPAALQDGDYQERLAGRLAAQFEEAGLGSGQSETQYDAVVSNTSNFDLLLNILLLMSGLLALVGGLGLTGTMSLNVLERTREIGVLRAFGASNGAVRKVVLFEGTTVGLISWIFSTVLALPFGYLLANTVSEATLQTQARFRFSTLGPGLWLVLILVIGTLASLVPAHRATQLTVREVLAYE